MFLLLCLAFLGLFNNAIASDNPISAPKAKIPLDASSNVCYVSKKIVDTWNEISSQTCLYNTPFMIFTDSLGGTMNPFDPDDTTIPPKIRSLQCCPIQLLSNKKKNEELCTVQSNNKHYRLCAPFNISADDISTHLQNFREHPRTYHATSGLLTMQPSPLMECDEPFFNQEILVHYNHKTIHGSNSYFQKTYNALVTLGCQDILKKAEKPCYEAFTQHWDRFGIAYSQDADVLEIVAIDTINFVEKEAPNYGIVAKSWHTSCPTGIKDTIKLKTPPSYLFPVWIPKAILFDENKQLKKTLVLSFVVANAVHLADLGIDCKKPESLQPNAIKQAQWRQIKSFFFGRKSITMYLIALCVGILYVYKK